MDYGTLVFASLCGGSVPTLNFIEFLPRNKYVWSFITIYNSLGVFSIKLFTVKCPQCIY